MGRMTFSFCLALLILLPTVTAILQALKDHVIVFPDHNDDIISVQRGFGDLGFPRGMGAIDGTHVRIMRPPDEENAFINRKGYPSINCQAVCDAEGAARNCSDEGADIHIDLVSEDPCISCKCTNGTVKCVKQECEPIDGCHLILYPKPVGTCCDTCKGCDFKGKTYRSGESWTDQDSPCRDLICQAGVITETNKICHATCENPTPVHGRCCPQCRGCTIRGKRYKEGELFAPELDKCVKCRCQKGQVVCSKKACPIPNCPIQSQVLKEGECCPKCSGSRTVFNLNNHCLFGAKVHRDGAKFAPDTCSTCSCQLGTTVCFAVTCPPLDCEGDDIITTPGECCQKCRPKEECMVNGTVAQHGSSWPVDECSSCRCDDGEVKCGPPVCEELSCPGGQHPEVLSGACCPTCVDNDGVCSVFGDPHYRTYDGHMYHFQGTCKYILTKTCLNSEFQIRVRNHARLTENYAWTKMATVYFNRTRIDLRQRLEIKVNRRKVSLPYGSGERFTIEADGHSAVIKIANGIQVTWDGDSYLEVIIPKSYRNKMCGLCGNYNGNPDDDFKSKKGNLFTNSDDFGEDWRYGSKKACQVRKKKLMTSPCLTSFSRKLLAYHECSVIYSAPFEACKDRVDPKPYYRSCVADVCDCPALQQCSCEALHAYERACEIQGVKVQPWRTLRLCGAPKCPIGAYYDQCGPACPTTCENFMDAPSQSCNLPCVPGCQCPQGTALYNNRCIKTKKCPKHFLIKKENV